MKKHKVWLALTILIALSGCGGRSANPTKTSQPGDHQLSCFALKSELMDIEEYMRELVPDTKKIGKNVGLGVAGWFFIVPWIFMDFSEAEQQELEAYRKRYNYLTHFYNTNKCYVDKPRLEIPPFNKTKH